MEVTQAPIALAALPNWIAWRYVDGDKKVPFNARNGKHAKTNDPSTWVTYPEACASLTFNDFSGLGFVFATDGGLFGVDLDGCIGPRGIEPWAQKIIDRLNTYAEISPSGTGVKLWGLGKLSSTTGKKKQLDVEKCCDKSPAIEAYDHGRYFAFTGDRVPGCPTEPRNCQSELDGLIEQFWPSLKPIEPPKPSTGIATRYDPMGVPERAARYLDVLPVSIDGQGGHNAAFRAACVLVLGFDLKPENAFPLLATWNARCQPPWSDKDLWHKLGDADTRTGERGWLLQPLGRYTGPDVDLRAIMAQCEAIEPSIKPRSVFDDGPMPVDALRVGGLIGDVVKYNLDSSIYPQPELALAGAIALMGTITGRKVTDFLGTRTNVYVMGLCPPAAGKEQSRSVNKQVLIQAGGERYIGPESIGSAAGLISALSEQPAMLFQLDEIARLFATMQSASKSPHLFNVGSNLLKLYSSSSQIFVGDAYADLKKIKRITQPHAVVYGTSVPSSFWESLTAENVTEGLVGRFMVFDSSLGYDVDPVEPQRQAIPQDIVERVAWWLNYAKGGNLAAQNPIPHLVEYTDDARSRIKEHMTAIARRRRSEQDTHAALWSRSAEKAIKLALIFACSRSSCHEPHTVELDDVDRAIRLCNWLTRKMLRKVTDHVADGQYDALVKKVLRKITTSGITLSELAIRTQFLKSRERQEIVEHLALTGQVFIETEQTGGRPKTSIKKL